MTATTPPETLALAVCNRAMDRLASLPAARTATPAQLDSATAAMRASAKVVIPTLIADAARTPVTAFDAMIATAVLAIATAGHNAMIAGGAA